MYTEAVYEPMASEVVQFREPAEMLARLRQAGINPNELGREAFERAARRALAERWEKDARAHAVTLPKSAVELIREERDDH